MKDFAERRAGPIWTTQAAGATVARVRENSGTTKIRKIGRKILSVLPEVNSFLLNRQITTPQPKFGRAVVAFTVLTKAGHLANGKGTSHEFLQNFCGIIRNAGLRTVFVSSLRELERLLSDPHPVLIVHLYGEDHATISSSKMDALERQAVAVFNGSRTGELLADKLMSHHAFEAGGVPVPPLSESSGFVRSRAGTRLETFVERGDDGGRFSDDSQIRTAFVDTVIDFENRSYFTTVRLVCVDDIILHAYPRARDVQERNASVHASNTPLNPPLIEFLQEKLVNTRSEELSRVARELFSVLGHGFYAHDLLIDRRDGSVSVCESGFKFYDNAYHDRMEPIAADLPSQAVLFPVEAFARLSAHAFVARCDGLLAQRD